MKLSKIFLLLCIIITVLFASCTNKTKKAGQYEYIESINHFDEVYYGLITSYTSGFVSENQPLQISFNSDVKLKKVFGEVINAKVFDISPKIKGEVFWVNENTIGYRFLEKPDNNKVYKTRFNLKEFIDSPSTLPSFNFDFIVRAQDFSISETYYTCNKTDTCQLSYELSFVNPIDAQEVLTMIDNKISKKYSCYAEQINNKKVRLIIANIPRQDKEYTLAVNFSGEPLGINNKYERKFTVPAKSVFEFVNHYIQNEAKSVTVEFSNQLNPNSNIIGLVYVSENYAYNIQVNDNKLTLTFENTQYIIDKDIFLHIDGNLKDIDSKRLETDVAFTFIFTNSDFPSINWIDNGYIVPGLGDATIYFEAANLNSVVLRIIRIYDNNVLDFLQNNSFSDTYSVRHVGRLERKVKIALASDDWSKKKVYGIKLADYVNVNSGDLFQISLDYDMTCYTEDCENKVEKDSYDDTYWDNGAYDYKSYYYGSYWWRNEDNPCSQSFYNYVEIKKNVLVSDIGVTAKYADDEIINVYVRGISDAKPVANCKVKIFNYQKQIVGEATTDVDGRCRIKPEGTPYFVEATDEISNKAYIKLEKSQAHSLSNFDVSGTSIKHNINGYIYSNRDVWRPGDSIHLNFILSDVYKTIPSNFPIILEVFDSQGKLVMKKVNNEPVGNIYSFAYATEPSDPTGLWSAYIHLGNNKFYKNLRVETVKPNRLKIDLTLPKQISLNQLKPMTLNSTWLTGLPASNLTASVDVKLFSMTTSFKDFPGYSFVNVSSDFVPLEVNIVNSLKLNDKGNANLDLKSLTNLSLPGFSKAVFTTKVFEGDGDFSISSSSTSISPFKRYIGVRKPEPQSKYGSYYFTEHDWDFEVVLVGEDGKLVSTNDELVLNVYRLDRYWWWWSNYDENLSKYVNGTYKNFIIDETIKLKNGKGKFTLNFPDKDYGTYLIVVIDQYEGHIYSDIANFDYPYYDRNRSVGDAPAILSLKTDKDTYQVGETMLISFPANTKAQALVSVETATNIVESINVTDLKEDAAVKVVVTEAMLPNAYVHVTLFQPYNSENDLPLRLYGIVPIKVEDPATRLYPLISMPKESNSQSTIDINVSEKNGKAMYYTLALVDEGILGITSFRTPDPHTELFAKQALRINTWDNYKGVIDAYEGEMNSVFAVGGDMEFQDQETVLSKRFQAVAYSFGPFELKANAKEKHTINIPEYVGSLRAMVVASNNKNAYGKAQENIIVKDPIMIMPTAPKVVSPKDEFVIPVQILAPDMIGKNIKVDLAVDKLNVIGKNSATVTTNANGEATAEFRLKVPEASGNIKINLTASADNITAKSEIIIPIRMPFTLKQSTVLEKVEANSSKTINLSFAGIDGTASGQVSINTLIPLELFSHLDFLISYPHGCLEQTVSKAFPQLYLDYFMNFDEKQMKSVKTNVEAAISALKNYVRTDYSMTNWIGGYYVQPWSEIYAAHFLIEAKNRGYNVTDDMLRNVMKYHASKARAWNYSVDHPTSDVYQAYRLFVLALNNTPEAGAMNRFREQENLQQLSKVLLSATYALSGKMKIAQEILAEVKYDPTKTMSDWYTSYGSYTRDYAFYTYAEMLIDADEAIVRNDILNICKEFSDNRWMPTQTAAFSLFVLGKYAEKFNMNKDNLEVTAIINGKSNHVNTNKSSAVFDFIPIKDNKIEIRNITNGVIYASVYSRGYVAEYDTIEAGAEINMKVNYYDKNGKKINPKSLAKNTEFNVEITVENTNKRFRITDNTLSYILPGGWEIVNNRMFDDYYENNINYIDIRDDRAYFYFDLMPTQKITLTVNLAAIHTGKFTVPQVRCEDMYNNEIFYVVPALDVEVK